MRCSLPCSERHEIFDEALAAIFLVVGKGKDDLIRIAEILVHRDVRCKSEGDIVLVGDAHEHARESATVTIRLLKQTANSGDLIVGTFF